MVHTSRVIAAILSMLFNQPMRSKELVNSVRKELEHVSPQMMYPILKKLENDDLIIREEISPKNIQYRISPKGRILVKEEIHKTTETLIAIIRHSVKHQEIIAEVLLADLSEKIDSPKLQDPEKRKILRNLFESELQRLIDKTALLLSQ